MHTANSSVDSPELVTNSFRFRCCLFVAAFICMFVCLIDLVMFYLFLFSFYLFLTLVHLTSTQTLRFPSSVYG